LFDFEHIFQEEDDFHLQYEDKEPLKREREQQNRHSFHREEEEGEEV
jgi:hypothetical protein